MAWKPYSLNIATYNAASNQFSNEQVLSTFDTDTAPRLAFASGTDLFLGIGDAIELLPDSRVHTKIYTKSDDLIRYSPQTKQLVARYDISTLRAGYRNGDVGNYRVFEVGNQTLVVDTISGEGGRCGFSNLAPTLTANPMPVFDTVISPTWRWPCRGKVT